MNEIDSSMKKNSLDGTEVLGVGIDSNAFVSSQTALKIE